MTLTAIPNTIILPVNSIPLSGMSFPGLEIRLHQRRVLKDGADINLTRLEYNLALRKQRKFPPLFLTTQRNANMAKFWETF